MSTSSPQRDSFNDHPDNTCVSISENVTFSSSSDWEKSKSRSLPSTHISDQFGSEVSQSIQKRLDDLSDELHGLSLKIHDHPELGYQEHFAHDTLSQFMQEKGFDVTRHYLGLETAWRASYEIGEGGPVLGFCSEMDALPGIGHACGHNVIAMIGVGCALSVACAMQHCNIPARIVLLGTPAEEGGQGKVKLINTGGFKEMDACLMAHPSPGAPHSAGTGSCLAVQRLYVEYHGHSAHAAGAPWEGRNALDAAFLAYSAISVLRQQIKPTHRVHGIVEGRDWAANVIPEYSKMTWLVRAPTYAEVEVLRERVKKCFEAAALATECQMEYSAPPGTFEVRQNVCLADEFTKAAEYFGIQASRAIPAAVGGSTDFGNVTYELPALHPSFAIPTEDGGGNHTALFTKAAATSEAHNAAIQIAKALAITGSRLITDADFRSKVKTAFRDGHTTGFAS